MSETVMSFDDESKTTDDNDMGDDESNNETTSSPQYLCDYCRKDISGVIRIRCCECADFNLCLLCFSTGVEINIDDDNSHKRTHKYRVIDHVTDAIFDEDWGADEEIMMLEGLERYGMGNWQDVANHIGIKAKTKQRCELHYHATYLNSSTKPLPNPDIVLTPATYPKDPTNYDMVPSSTETLSVSKAVGGTKPRLSAETVAAGYRPKRGEFDTEYDNAAETILGDMTFTQQDSPLVRRLQMSVLGSYHRKLDARHERKKFAERHGLLYSNREMKHKSKDFKLLHSSLKKFARFHTREEHQQFVEDVYRERGLVRDIQELSRRREEGVRNFPEELCYIEEKTIRDMWIANVTDVPEADRAVQRGVSRHDAASAAIADLARRRPTIPEVDELEAGGLDTSNMECVELLTADERKLCCQLKLIPRHYNLMKNKIVLDSYTHGFVSRNDVCSFWTINPDIIRAVYDFIVSLGIINSSLPANIPPPPYSRPPQPTLKPQALKSIVVKQEKSAVESKLHNSAIDVSSSSISSTSTPMVKPIQIKRPSNTPISKTT